MVLMAGYDLPVRAIREQISAALDLIMHLDRMPDGRRVVTSVTELQGMEGDTILLQEIFKYRMHPRHLGEDATANAAKGELVATGLRPKFLDKLKENGVDVPAKAFRSTPIPAPAPAAGRGRRQVPEVATLARAERAR